MLCLTKLLVDFSATLPLHGRFIRACTKILVPNSGAWQSVQRTYAKGLSHPRSTGHIRTDTLSKGAGHSRPESWRFLGTCHLLDAFRKHASMIRYCRQDQGVSGGSSPRTISLSLYWPTCCYLGSQVGVEGRESVWMHEDAAYCKVQIDDVETDVVVVRKVEVWKIRWRVSG